jgi:D-aminopeptidase
LARLRELGITLGHLPPGPCNAITDVPGVRVGHTTIVSGDRVRTGVTAIHPHEGSVFRAQVPAATAVLNGAGEMTGRAQIDEYGLLESPILLTSTHAVGIAHRACLDWMFRREEVSNDFVIPVVAETWDGVLSDACGAWLTAEHVEQALDSASAGPVAEGNVGGGTGMGLFHFKGGIGTASRRVTLDKDLFTVGVLVQGNYGRRRQLRVDGVAVGEAIEDLLPVIARPTPLPKEGSVIVVIATDAPLDNRQLGRLARRGMLGLGRTGAIAGHTSGDLLLAFSNPPSVRVPRSVPMSPERVPVLLQSPRVHDAWLDPLFEAVIEATEESVINAMVAAQTMTGRDGNTLHALPHDRLRALVRGR